MSGKRPYDNMIVLDLDFVRQLLTYDPDTGVFRWLIRPTNRMRLGSLAGGLNKTGYRYIAIKGKYVRASRLAWAMSRGKWPSVFIDHINGVPDDDRLANLREVDPQQSRFNCKPKKNATGYPGVSETRNGRFMARFIAGGPRMVLGYFDTPEEAFEIYERVSREVQGAYHRPLK